MPVKSDENSFFFQAKVCVIQLIKNLNKRLHINMVIFKRNGVNK